MVRLSTPILCLSLTVSCTDSPRSQSHHPKAEAVSLLGEKLYPLSLDEHTAAKYSENLAQARADFDADSDDADAIIWLGRRTAYLGRYREAITHFSEGIRKHPEDARMYRHRGHRYITTRQFKKAVSDFEKAARLIRGHEDVIEPDGLPNRLNIPTSTLQSNIWYHLGLTHYLTGDLDGAQRAYRKCLEVSKNNDMLAATAYWKYLTLRRMGKEGAAQQLLSQIDEDFDVIENHAYRDLLFLFKGILTEGDIMSEGEDALQNATMAYGIASWRCLEGDSAGATEILDSIIATNYWPAFGYIAAESDLAAGRCYGRKRS